MLHTNQPSSHLTAQSSRGILGGLQRGLKGLLGFIKNEAALDRYVEEQRPTPEVSSPCVDGITLAVKRASSSKFYSPSATSVAPYGYFCGRPIIGDCSPISGGIYLSAEPCEALVIDEKYDALRLALKDFRGRVSEVIGQNMLDDLRLLKFTMGYVRERFKLDEERVRSLNKSLGGTADRKIALDSYLNSGYGASRHLVLLTGFLLEALKRHGMAVGCPSVDTSQGYERLIYTSLSGSLFVLDYTKNAVEAGH